MDIHFIMFACKIAGESVAKGFYIFQITNELTKTGKNKVICFEVCIDIVNVALITNQSWHFECEAVKPYAWNGFLFLLEYLMLYVKLEYNERKPSAYHKIWKNKSKNRKIFKKIGLGQELVTGQLSWKLIEEISLKIWIKRAR